MPVMCFFIVRRCVKLFRMVFAGKVETVGSEKIRIVVSSAPVASRRRLIPSPMSTGLEIETALISRP